MFSAGSYPRYPTTVTTTARTGGGLNSTVSMRSVGVSRNTSGERETVSCRVVTMPAVIVSNRVTFVNTPRRSRLVRGLRSVL